MARLLIVNADDFGYSPGVNAGIARAHRDGIVTATSVMANLPAASEAAAYRRRHARLAFGAHLTLTVGRPLTPRAQVASLVDEQGRFLRRDALLASAQPGEVALECRAQIAALEAIGIAPTHLDSHHHVHGFEPILSVATAIARERGLPVRPTSLEVRETLRAAGLPTADALLDDFYPFDEFKIPWLIASLAALPDGVTELVCHPGDPDEGLAALSSYVAPRAGEVAALVSAGVRRAVAEAGIRLVTQAEAFGSA